MIIMHESSMLRMKWFKEHYCSNNDTKKVVLDVGSYCVEGQQTYREFFNDESFEYIGLDMAEGPNVSIAVKTPYKWNEISDNFCDILISGQVFEHIEFPWLTMQEITRVVKPNGLICIIAPNGLFLHRYPVDCWRFYSDGMIALAKWAGLEVLHISTNLAPLDAVQQWYGNWQDCMLIARKPAGVINEIDVNRYICEPTDLEKMATGFVPMEKQKWYWQYFLKQYLRSIYEPILRLIKRQQTSA